MFCKFTLNSNRSFVDFNIAILTENATLKLHSRAQNNKIKTLLISASRFEIALASSPKFGTQ